MMVKILITGSEGFTGKYLREELEKNGYEVFRTDHQAHNGENFFQCDITDKESVRRVINSIKPRYIFHLAAFSIPGKSFDNEELCFKVTVEGTRNLLEASKNIVEKILIPSSTHVYGNPLYDPVDEKHPLHPLPHPYSRAKFEQEKLARTYPNTVIVRAFNYTGEGQSSDFVIPSFKRKINEAKEGEVISVGNLDIIRDFSDVNDVVRAYRLIIEKGKIREIYNVGSGKGYNLKNILEKLIKDSGKHLRIEIDPKKFRFSEVPKIICDNRKIKKLGATFRKLF